MVPRSSSLLAAGAVLTTALVLGGCGHGLDGLQPARGNMDPVVFDDNFGRGVGYQAFLGSKVDAVSTDPSEHHSGTASLKVTVPGPGDPSGTYAGGAFTCNQPRDLADYDALTFWAKASMLATLDVAGFGNDNTGTSKYTAERRNIALTTDWTRYVLPIPITGKLLGERGLFFLAEGPELGVGYDVWFDDVRFEKLGTITNPRPGVPTQTVSGFVGSTVSVTNTNTAFTVDGNLVVMFHSPAYFTFTSSADSIARQVDGLITVTGSGTCILKATLGEVPAAGSVTVNAVSPPIGAPPAPTVPSSNVISLWSRAYSNVPVDTWSATWDRANLATINVGGDDIKAYTNLLYAGIEFIAHQIDASAMTAYHMDVWLPEGNNFRVKLVDFGANGVYDGGGDDSSSELAFTPGTTPPIANGQWVSLEVPLANFTGLTNRAHLAQLVLSCDAPTVFVDNVYFHN